MSYAYDAFISYRKTEMGRFWVSEYFAPCLRHELSELLGRDAWIFFDLNDVRWNTSSRPCRGSVGPLPSGSQVWNPKLR